MPPVGAAAAGALGAHAWLLAAHDHGVALNLVLIPMLLVCAWCAVHTWRHTSRRGLALLQAMSLAMAIGHVVLALGVPGITAATPHAGHGAPGTLTAAAAPAAMGMLGVAGLELLVAGYAGYAKRPLARRIPASL
ncbi:hypothetical protein [Arthrobacter sp. KK5.5]|uniref:hypothetical protein n=1 Tax=Arthrobacter sp. KK5.5 TaxID=3373084 RepID=UPI003EE42D8D